MWFTDRAVGRSSYSRLAQCVSVHYLVAMVIMDLEGDMTGVPLWMETMHLAVAAFQQVVTE